MCQVSISKIVIDMSKLYVFGIGGTGARVLRSLSMLLASGVHLGSGIEEVVPILIDPDAGNADLTRTTYFLSLYQSIQLELNRPTKNEFFKTKITSITGNNILSINNTSNCSFAQYIGLDTMDNTEKGLVKMLFSKENLDADMKVGFKGNPNIGSVVLNQIIESQAFKSFEASFSQGDRIFIVNSIFGGTGASGFPLLLKILREITVQQAQKFAMLNDALIGAVTVLPYFSIKPDPNSSINSSTFISKAKSALAYYEENIFNNGQIDALYFIGDDKFSKPYDNTDGGPGQQNKAHIVEFLAATSVVDFTYNKNINHQQAKSICQEIGIKNDSNPVTFVDFYDKTFSLLFDPLVSFTLMANGFHYKMKDISSPNVEANRNRFSSIYQQDFMRNLTEFLDGANGYRDWLGEMETNSRSLKLFDLACPEKPFDIVQGIIPKKDGIFAKKNYNKYIHELNDAIRRCSVTKPEDPNTFMEMFYLAMKKITQEKF